MSRDRISLNEESTYGGRTFSSAFIKEFNSGIEDKTGVSCCISIILPTVCRLVFRLGQTAVIYDITCTLVSSFLIGYTESLRDFAHRNASPELSVNIRAFIDRLSLLAETEHLDELGRTFVKQPSLNPKSSRQWSKKDLTSVGNIYENPGAFVDGFPAPPEDAIFFEDSEMYVIGSESYDSLYIPELWRHLNQTMWGYKEMTGASRIYGFNVELMPALGSVFAIYEGESWGDILAKMKKELMEGIETEGSEPAVSFEDACLSFEISSAKKDVIFIYEHGTVVNI